MKQELDMMAKNSKKEEIRKRKEQKEIQLAEDVSIHTVYYGMDLFSRFSLGRMVTLCICWHHRPLSNCANVQADLSFLLDKHG